MTWLFIIPLVLALILLYIFKNSADDIANLAFAVVIISLVLSLVFAPWQVQCLLLVMTLLASSKLLNSSSKALEIEEDKPVKLFYRGANYNSTPKTEITETEKELVGVYRGQVWRSRKDSNLLVTPQSSPTLRYRGAKVN
jgi:membrane protein implicated in regulation of membrane protease activity